ncbi:AAA family ATPase [Alienimonas californiensis]|uniref:ATPase family associated with various cellular activities (AAA) n=1 Tax=Alienimonas californiensis TaxID=2527989 RepID=A0A517PFC8_9PLAN|nr:AAA family ATPase [Alienimonas californiensis]QDT18065.1 ATPase family associated with various cellular activities (AAA) [Alienimonas californiensis]
MPANAPPVAAAPVAAPSPAEGPATEADLAELDRLAASYRSLTEQIGRAIVGQTEAVEQTCVALLAGGHALLVGVPGLAKTLLVRTLAEALDLDFNRVQFTPDLMPADVSGGEVPNHSGGDGPSFRFEPGPIFTNVLLADEINRTPPKTQAALLEAMQERQVTAAGRRHPLPDPFFVLATQNPIESEGTYPLPEAQLDRFLLQIAIDYPSEEDEVEVVRRTTAGAPPRIEPVIGRDQLLAARAAVRKIAVSDSTLRYATRLARASRPGADVSGVNPGALEFVSEHVRWGAGPRAAQALILCAKARAALRGEVHAGGDDVAAVAPAALRHRILPNFHADAAGLTADDLVARLIAAVPRQPDAGPRWLREILP